jgi:2-keto-4-pentenoate hydratase/2-oxohepta-3-ene-1,7-dioic acid hydratase in catechol pathway
MRIIRFLSDDGQIHLGSWTPEAPAARRIEGSLFESWRETEDELPIAKLLAPVEPPNIFGIGLNYRAHAAEGNREVPTEPLIFSKATTAVIAPGEPIQLPAPAPSKVDYEAELGVIIGRTARQVSQAAALEYVFGYTCVNDVTARDLQKKPGAQWSRAKGFDTFCPMGPCVVPAAELDPTNLRVRSELNGQIMQDDTTAQMVFPVAELVSYLSHQFTLLPGTLICTGTPSGVGFAKRSKPNLLGAWGPIPAASPQSVEQEIRRNVAWCPIPLALTDCRGTGVCCGVEARGGGRIAADCVTLCEGSVSRGPPTPGSAALHPGLHSVTRCAGS